MPNYLTTYIRFSLILLISTLVFGLLASWAFIYPEFFNKFLPFYQLRPFHVSASLFWIISGASGSILIFKKEILGSDASFKKTAAPFVTLWMVTIVVIFGCYAFKQFGGREYWEFPPVLSVPLTVCWVLLMVAYFGGFISPWKKAPLYMWMWSTGVFFFMFTLLEQNIWQIPWFRYSYLRDVTVQWKSNGSMVGAWNQMIYGVMLYVMVKITGDDRLATSKSAFFFYFLGFTNLLFNWGHHIYNVPTANWIRTLSYSISMTETIFLIKMIVEFKRTIEERRRLRHLIPYRFFIAAEFWVFANLVLVLFMSVPAINRYTHGTHITVAHAMVATIGINTMILLGSIGFILDIDSQPGKKKKILGYSYWITQVSLMIFWFALIGAGIVKGYRSVTLNISSFQEVMQPVIPFLKVTSYAGFGLLGGIGTIAFIYIGIKRK